MFPNDLSEIALPPLPRARSRGETVIADAVSTPRFSLAFTDRGGRRKTTRSEGYGAGDLKYGHVDAKNIGGRDIRFIRCIADPNRAHGLHRECEHSCAPGTMIK